MLCSIFILALLSLVQYFCYIDRCPAESNAVAGLEDRPAERRQFCHVQEGSVVLGNIFDAKLSVHDKDAGMTAGDCRFGNHKIAGRGFPADQARQLVDGIFTDVVADDNRNFHSGRYRFLSLFIFFIIHIERAGSGKSFRIRRHVLRSFKNGREVFVVFFCIGLRQISQEIIDKHLHFSKAVAIAKDNDTLQSITVWNKIGHVVVLLAERLHISPNEALRIFYESEVCKQLHDPQTNLYLYSDLYIVDELVMEIQNR